MKKIILLTILLIVTIWYNKECYGQFQTIDSISVTIGTATFDTVSLGSGTKSFSVWNKTTGVINVSFPNGSNNRDTLNVQAIPSGNKFYFLSRKDTKMFVKAVTSGNINVVIYYGDGIPVIELPLSSNGQLSVSTLANVDTSFIWAVDTVNGAGDTLSKFSTYTLTNLSTKFPNKWQLTITADSTIEVSTTAAFTAGQTFRVKTGESWTSSYYSGLTAVYIRRHSSITGVTTWRADIHGY